MLSSILLTYIFVFELSNCQKWQQERKPVVRIQQGLLEGIAVYTDSSKLVSSYLGVPYAAPPIGALRFSPPQKHLGWNGTYQATNFQSRCPQLPLKPGVTDVEDCLHLSIWAPLNMGNYAPLPVIVFFECIDFFKSSSISLSGQDLAAEGVVVITVNYRLNVFGFFCLGTSESRGNLGILDQYFALLWIKENIKQFGGDPEKLTLFGYLSGAVSVALHMVSPRTAGLFQRAIISSGSVVTPWQIDNDPIVASKEIIRLVGCDAYTLDILGCLRSKKVEDILEALQEYSESNIWTDKFLPVVDTFLPEDNRYLPTEPSIALRDGKLQVPILTGITKPITYSQLTEWLDLASQGFSQLQQYMERAKIPEIIKLYKFNGVTKDDIIDLIKWKYASSSQGDVRVLFDQVKNLEFEAKIEAPHFLQLSHLVTSYIQPIFVYYVDDLGVVLNTTDHLATSDLLLLFGPVLLKQVGRRRFNSNEMRLSAQIKQMWMNFIIFGYIILRNVLLDQLPRQHTSSIERPLYTLNWSGCPMNVRWTSIGRHVLSGLIQYTLKNANSIWNEHFSNPTPNNIRVKPWRKYTAGDPYIEVFQAVETSSTNEEAKKRNERVAFWNQLLPKISQHRNTIANSIPREFQSSPDPAAGFRHAMYTLVGLVVALMALLVICIILLKKRSKDRERHIHLGY